MEGYGRQYKEELLGNVIPFWEKHSVDKEMGGYFTCLDREGWVYDTDKFCWLQGRQVWTFATMFNNIGQQEQWLDIARHGAAFLLKHGRDEEGSFYFSFRRDGQPLVMPYNIFSDCFAAMGLGTLYKADGKDEYAEVARATFNNILARRDNPKGKYSKGYPGTRDLKNFALPMILCNLSLELEHLVDKPVVEALIDEVLHEVMDTFYDERTGLILENVYADGSFCDSFEGRLVNPGHIIEAMWFIMDLGVRRQDMALVNRAADIALHTLEFGWDNEHGGILYFKDILGHPPQQLEWDQKLWWVHLETLVCLAKAWKLTGRAECAEWFTRVHDYTWKGFADPQYGEWFGYLNRRGEVLLPLKGGKWKGCFHVPRALYQVYKTLEQ